MAELKNNQSIVEQQSSEGIFPRYKGGEEMPLAGYAALLRIYNAVFFALLLAKNRKSASNTLPKPSGKVWERKRISNTPGGRLKR